MQRQFCIAISAGMAGYAYSQAWSALQATQMALAKPSVIDTHGLEKMHTSTGKDTPIVRDSDVKNQLEDVSNRIDGGKDPRTMTSQERANFLLSLDTGFRYMGRLYYGGSRYGKAGMYDGNALNYIGVGAGLAALGASRVQMQATILYWKGSEYLRGNTDKPWSAGTFQFAES